MIIKQSITIGCYEFQEVQYHGGSIGWRYVFDGSASESFPSFEAATAAASSVTTNIGRARPIPDGCYSGPPEKSDGGPAFPREDYQSDDARGQRGMSLLDWFAGQALIGLVATNVRPLDTPNIMARKAYQIAAEMLKARSE